MLGFAMKLWMGTLPVAFLLAKGTSRQEKLSETQKLRCYKCYSPESWDNCRENLTAVECTRQGDICYKIKRTSGEGSQSKNLKVIYAKGCNMPNACSGEECKENNWHCEVSCCNTDFCNGTVQMSGNFLLIIASLSHAFELIFYF
ncbi:uncharacterized protein LOC111337167 [Stylophora pistillata]|uniref:uncharacterized protein LOC111337167 n=1 Tax=Stylophora pistillata TaxID=50429 RepID=UPI000C03A08C|nr:uncharacterized protein LOC111337167 [Stylophora pistillata]